MSIAAENDRRFEKHLDESHAGVMAVADWLRGMGFPVRINPTFKRPSRDQWKEFADGGDLEIGQRIEVKRRGFNFTGAADWPYESFLVMALHAWDNARPKPHAIITLSADMTHAGIVYGRDREQWRVERTKDGRYIGCSQDILATEPTSVRWQRIR